MLIKNGEIMKKIIFIIIIALLSGCTTIKETHPIEGIDDVVWLQLNDTLQLEPTSVVEEVEFSFSAEGNVITVLPSGLVEAILAGETQLTISAKSHHSRTVRVVVVENPEELRVHFIDVGQADAMIALLPNGETLMIDAGLDHYTSLEGGNYPSWDHIEEVLTQENISVIDHLIITHNHSDHYYYIPEIVKNFTVHHVYTSGSTRTNSQYLFIMQSIANAGLTVEVVSVGDKLIDEDGLTLQVVSTKQVQNELSEEVNYSSVVTKLTYMNRAFLFTGDAGFATGDGENIALESNINLKADVLKVGHHGSSGSSSSRFLNAIQPTIAIITTAILTTTGHPHDVAVRRIERIGATIYQSKIHGTISIITNGFELDVQTEKVGSE